MQAYSQRLTMYVQKVTVVLDVYSTREDITEDIIDLVVKT